MTISKKLSVILPVYNEQNNIDSIILDISTFSQNKKIDSTIIVINDGSTDNSKKIVKDIKINNKLIYFEHETNMGYSKTLSSGIKIANDEGYILVMDADHQFKFENVIDLLDHTGQYDIIAGQRLNRQDGLMRKSLGIFWSLIGRFIFKTSIKDLNCGFKLFRADLIKKIKLDSIGPGFNLEVFSDPIIRDSRIKIVEIPHYPRRYGNQSGIRMKTVLCSFKDLRIIFNKRFF